MFWTCRGFYNWPAASGASRTGSLGPFPFTHWGLLGPSPWCNTHAGSRVPFGRKWQLGLCLFGLPARSESSPSSPGRFHCRRPFVPSTIALWQEGTDPQSPKGGCSGACHTTGAHPASGLRVGVALFEQSSLLWRGCWDAVSSGCQPGVRVVPFHVWTVLGSPPFFLRLLSSAWDCQRQHSRLDLTTQRNWCSPVTLCRGQGVDTCGIRASDKLLLGKCGGEILGDLSARRCRQRWGLLLVRQTELQFRRKSSPRPRCRKARQRSASCAEIHAVRLRSQRNQERPSRRIRRCRPPLPHSESDAANTEAARDVISVGPAEHLGNPNGPQLTRRHR